MAAPYSTDLREKVLAKYDQQELQNCEIAKLFNIDVKTLYNWIQRRKKTGLASPKKHIWRGRSYKITDVEKFKKFIADNPNLNQKELSEKWGGVSESTIGRALHRIGFTFKKNVWLQRTQ